MAKQETLVSKKRGPSPTGQGTPVMVRLQPHQLAALDRWIELNPEPRPTRPEALRRLARHGLQDASALQSTHVGMDAWDAAVARLDVTEKKRKGR